MPVEKEINALVDNVIANDNASARVEELLDKIGMPESSFNDTNSQWLNWLNWLNWRNWLNWLNQPGPGPNIP